MDYIVMDLEWNQGAAGRDKQNKQVPFEIIEIGAIKLNDNFEIVSDFSQIIAPTIYKEMHRITRELIHLDMKQLSKGRPFTEVATDFFKWCGDDYVFCTWGMMDLTELQRNINYYKLPIKLAYPLKYYDVQKLFSIAYEDRKTRRSLEFAADYLKIDKNSNFHRAGSDAYYTALVLQTIDKRVLSNYSIDYYRIPTCRKEEVYAIYDTYSKYISRGFTTREKAMADREIVSTRCYLCGKTARKKIRWFSTNNKIYYCLCTCETHGYLKGKLRIKHNDEGLSFAVKTLKLVSEEDAVKVRQRQEAEKKKRREKKEERRRISNGD